MSQQDERIAAVQAASVALGDPADYFETTEVKGKAETAEGIVGAFGGTKPAEQRSTTSQVFARDLIAVAEWIAGGADDDTDDDDTEQED